MMENFNIEPDETTTTVLVVDDMAANRAVLARQLEMHNYAVIGVDSGQAALDLLARSRPDIVLLDYMMPKMNGIEVLRELRSNPATADLPVIMVTARAESEATIEALDAGADDYVTKPIDFGSLRARIKRHLAKNGDTSELLRCNAVLDERMTMRSLVLADMEEELREEIVQRRELEAKLAGAPQAESAVPVVGADAVEQLRAIKSKFDNVFQSVVSGQTPNLAQMYELNELMQQLIDANCEEAQ